jgi:uncharacterized small protein (DUF1192 family)
MPIQEVKGSYSSEFEKRAADIVELMRIATARKVQVPVLAELEEEIAVTTAELQKKEAEISAAVGNEAFNYGLVLKLKTERLELASYLRGLQFCASRASKT